MAVAAGLTLDDDDKVSLTFKNAGSRRLMASNLAVNVTITMQNEAAARNSLSLLTIQKINEKLGSVGFPIATLVESPYMDLPPTTTSLTASSSLPVNSTSNATAKSLTNGVGIQRPSFASGWFSIVAVVLVLAALFQNFDD